MRVAVVASAQIFGGFQNLPPPQSLDFPAFFGLSHLFPPRLSISVIFDTDLVTLHHPSADQIYLEIRAKDPRISRGTVYRNLNILSEEGQITHVKVPGADRYDGRTDFHYHLICTGCGAVCDAPFSYDPTPDKTIAAESGYRITRHRMIFEGVCPACQKAGHEK